MRTLYLHTGVHRTATTSIQRFMRLNFAALLQKGHLHPFGIGRHANLVRRLVSGDLAVSNLAKDLNARADSKEYPISSITISDEDLSLIKNFSFLKPLQEHFNVKIVVSLRRQDLWLESWYLQNSKWQWNPKLFPLTYDEFFQHRHEFHWINYETRLAHYEKIFGEGCVVPNVFERSSMPDGPVSAFLDQIGIKDHSGFEETPFENSSLTPMMTEFLLRLPIHQFEDRDRDFVLLAVHEADKTLKTNGSMLVMPYAQREIIYAEYEASNKSVAQRYFNRDQLFSDPLIGPDAPLANTDLPRDADTILKDFVQPIFSALADRMRKNP